MNPSFRTVAPFAEPWFDRLAQSPLIHRVNETAWVFAAIETAHLLSLAVLGGAVFGLALRLLGLALTGVAPSEVERRTRPWLHIGVVGAIGTGVLMGVINAATLYPSVAFFVKMVALVAAILFSLAVVGEVARNPQTPSRTGVALALAAFAIWGFALFVFVANPRVNPGAVLIVIAGVALLAAAARRHRPALLGGLGALALGDWLFTHVVLSPNDEAAVAGANIGFAAAAFLFALAIGALEVRTEGRDDAPAKLVGFASALVWVTVAAAGRWIGFS